MTRVYRFQNETTEEMIDRFKKKSSPGWSPGVCQESPPLHDACGEAKPEAASRPTKEASQGKIVLEKSSKTPYKNSLNRQSLQSDQRPGIF